MKKRLFAILGILMLIGAVTIDNGVAQATPPIKVTLALDKSVYVPGDPMRIVMALQNQGANEVITTKGFSDREFYLLIQFFDEQGNVITSDKLNETNALTPEPPRVFPDDAGVLVQGDLVEILESGWVLSFSFYDPTSNPPVDLDAYDFYPLADRSGNFTAKAVIPMRTYPDYLTSDSGIKYAFFNSIEWQGDLESNLVSFTQIADVDNDGYYYPVLPPGESGDPDCDDNNPDVNPGVTEIMGNGIDDDCNPSTPDVVVADPGFIMIRADKHTVGAGSHPGSTKEPIPNMPVRVYDKSTGSCVSNYGVSWHHYKSVWSNCNEPNGVGITDPSSGIGNIAVPPGDYIVIGRHDPDDLVIGDEVYLGVSAGGVESGQTMEKYLQMIVKADKKKVPAKYTKKSGSELLIIEPEYIEWDGIQELYPFVFDSEGAWSVTTAVIPPEGFVADNNNLSEDVNTEVEAVQFTITDVGSDWVSTCVKHTVKHRKKTEAIYSGIGVKLTKSLAEEKGIDIWEMAETARETEQELRERCQEAFQEGKQEGHEDDKEERPKKGGKK